MFATWPMVFGALLAGLILGFIIPERSPNSQIGAPVKVASDNGTDAAAAAPANDRAKTASTAPAKTDETPCDEQTWPHLSTSCLDRTNLVSQPVRVAPVRPADPAVALKTDDKSSNDAGRSNGGTPQNASQNVEDQPQARPTPVKSEPTRASVEPRNSPRPAHQAANAEPEQRDVDDEQERAPREADRPRSRQRTAKNRSRAARAAVAEELEQDDREEERPRIFIRPDGTRIYLVPEHRYVRRLDDTWRRW